MRNFLDMSDSVPPKVAEREGYLWLFMVLFITLMVMPSGMVVLLMWTAGMGYAIVKVWEFMGGKRGGTELD